MKDLEQDHPHPFSFHTTFLLYISLFLFWQLLTGDETHAWQHICCEDTMFSH